MAKISTIPNECPQCGGAVWDNTKKPKRNPKGPDAACKDKEGCGWAGWLDKPKTAGSPRVTYTWAELGNTYAKCAQVAKRVWGERDELVQATATLFIAAKDMGLKPEQETKEPS